MLLIGVVSFFADFTYEGARSVTGPFLAILGASGTVVGIVAGLGELLGYGLRSFVCSRVFIFSHSLLSPGVGLQFAVVVFLSVGLYSVHRLRHGQPVLKPLGWVAPETIHTVAAFVLGPSFAAGIALYLRLRNQSTSPIPIVEVLALGVVLGPILEESLFRGCLLPVLAQTTGTTSAVIITAVLFALFHGPTNVVHWMSFTATGVAYGWMRVALRSTTAAVIMHAAYNLSLFLFAAS